MAFRCGAATCGDGFIGRSYGGVLAVALVEEEAQSVAAKCLHLVQRPEGNVAGGEGLECGHDGRLAGSNRRRCKVINYHRMAAFMD